VRQNPIQRLLGLFIYARIALCTIVVHNIAQNRADNYPSYPPDNQHCSDDVYLREGGPSLVLTNQWTFFIPTAITDTTVWWSVCRHWRLVQQISTPPNGHRALY